MNAICLVTDRLQAGYLGCYGNAWIATPAANELAGESFLFDRALLDSPDLVEQCRQLWHDDLPARLSAAGVRTTLLTDEPLVANHPAAAGFADVQRVLAATGGELAGDVGETQFARFFSAAIERLISCQEPFCLWLHSQGMSAPWDAPLAFRERYIEGDDIPLPRFTAPPSFVQGDNADPDELLVLRWAYAAQVSLWDSCFDDLWQFLRTSRLLDDTLLIATSTRGFPLGEHRLVGAAADGGFQLHEELVHVPWLMHVPGEERISARSQALVQLSDLAPTLADWFHLPADASVRHSVLPLIREEQELTRQAAFVHSSAGEMALRTPDWTLLRAPSGTGEACGHARRQLYAKPDDRWEMNEVADRCQDVADAMESLALQCQRGEVDLMQPLPSELLP